MAKWLINHQDAIEMHQTFYDKPFEVVPVQKSGSFDRFPWSLFYGASDINSWNGLISTDGNKVVVTKAGYFKDGKITQKWDFSVDDIVSANFGRFKTTFNFSNRIDGLTTKSFLESILLLGCFLVPYLLYNSKKVNFRVRSEFKNTDSFFKLLGK